MFLNYTYYKIEENVRKQFLYNPIARNTLSMSLDWGTFPSGYICFQQHVITIWICFNE